MPVAKNSAELERMIVKQMQKAMQVTQRKIEADMHEEVGKFYTQGNPLLYTRTGGLANTPKTTNISIGGTTASFEAYLDPNQGWYGADNPNPAFTSRGWSSYFTPLQIISAAESHAAHIKGKGGFWSRSLKHMESDVKTVFGRYFK